MSSAQGTKKDSGKPRLSLVPGEALAAAARALGFGAAKYSDFNYRKGLDHRRIIDALLRHVSLYLEGEDKDPESGLSHVDHILANACMLAWMTAHRPDLDDRYKKEPNGK
jgi:hypothetical protein